MKKLEFTVGNWAGEARLLRGLGDPVSLMQTEEAQYKLDGLILLIERVGRTKSEITIGSEPPKKYMELTVSRQK